MRSETLLSVATPRAWLRAALSMARGRPLPVLLLVLFLAVACSGPAAQPPMSLDISPTPAAVPVGAAEQPALVLAGGTLVDGTGAPPIPDAAVVIRGNRILAAGPRADAGRPK